MQSLVYFDTMATANRRERGSETVLGKAAYLTASDILVILPSTPKEPTMPDLKNSRSESHLEKIAREERSGWVHYEAEAEAIRKKTARLKALRLAKEAADKRAEAEGGAVAKKRSTKKPDTPNPT
jgi:hypothetical protein